MKEAQNAKNLARSEFVGIDVSKDTLDVYKTKSNQYFTVKNDKKGIRSLLCKVKYAKQQLVLGSLTGGYEKEVVEEFTTHGYNVHRSQRSHE